MNWSTALSTMIGAIAGVGSTLVVDRIRWRRDKSGHAIEKRRDVYVDFLMALSDAHSAMRSATFRRAEDEASRYGTLHEALDSSGVWRLRQILSLATSHEIVSLAMTATAALQAVRDVLIVEFNTQSDLYFRARARLWSANAELRDAMRRDLGVIGPPDPELGLSRYPDDPTGPALESIMLME